MAKEEENMMELAEHIKELGYEVAINKCNSRIYYSNGVNIIEISGGSGAFDHYRIWISLIYKNTRYQCNNLCGKKVGIIHLSDITDEVINDLILNQREWAKEKISKDNRYANLEDLINKDNKFIETLKFKIV